MAIAIHSSTPALANGTTSVSTTSFTAPDGALLVALCAAEGGTGTTTVTNSSSALTWTTRVIHQSGSDAGAYGYTVMIATAAATAVARTVTLTTSNTGSGVNLKLLVVTGVDMDTPVGAVGEGHATTSNLTPVVYTSTGINSRAVGIATDDGSGSPVTSSDVGFAFNTFFTSGIAVYKAADTPVAGSSVTLNFNGGGDPREWNWAAAELLALPEPVRPRTINPTTAVHRSASW